MQIELDFDAYHEPTKDDTAAAPTEAAANTSPAATETLADLLDLVPTWTDLTHDRRRIMASHIRTVGLAATVAKLRGGKTLDCVRRADVDLTAIPCDAAWLNAHIFAYPSATYGVSTTAHRNAVSNTRYAMRRIGTIDPLQLPLPPPASEWGKFCDAIKAERHCLLGLARLASWCHATGVMPTDVDDQTLAKFEHYVTTRTLYDDIPGLLRSVRKAWQKAFRIIGKAPKNPITAPRRREFYTVPFAAFPLSFQHEVDRFARRLSGEGRRGPFSGDGPSHLLRPSTVKARLFSLRQAASALVILGRDPATITRLADLVEETAFEAILQHFWERAIEIRVRQGHYASVHEAPVEAGRTSQTSAIASTLMMIAKYDAKQPAEIIERRNVSTTLIQPGSEFKLGYER